jgi:hypothetical protein
MLFHTWIPTSRSQVHHIRYIPRTTMQDSGLIYMHVLSEYTRRYYASRFTLSVSYFFLHFKCEINREVHPLNSVTVHNFVSTFFRTRQTNSGVIP